MTYQFPEPCNCGDPSCWRCYGANAVPVCAICGELVDECDDPEAHREQAEIADGRLEAAIEDHYDAIRKGEA